MESQIINGNAMQEKARITPSIHQCKSFKVPQPFKTNQIRRSLARRHKQNKEMFRVRAASETSLRTPHSGYHFDGSGRRFFEGWYFKVTLDKPGEAFALIYSIEDPLGSSQASGVSAQVMGPDDSYLVHYSNDVKQFWASENSLELGANFEPGSLAPGRLMSEGEFNKQVQIGYQASQTWHQGNIVAKEQGVTGHLPSTHKTAKWAFSVKPSLGWGDTDSKQEATAGWLASLPVFEPHWQVLMALGSATGWIEWEGKRYEFTDANAYAEKNWGGGFPKKWFWIQCDQFQSPQDTKVALTIAGAIRGLLNLPVEEEVGMVGLHWGEKFLAFTPWTGDVKWDVDPWGRWNVKAEIKDYRVEVNATCDRPGTPLRAPTQNQGFSPQCKDSFFGQASYSLLLTKVGQDTMGEWRKDFGAGLHSPQEQSYLYNLELIFEARHQGITCELHQCLDENLLKVEIRLWDRASNELVLHATSNTAAVEIGGGPWWETWKSKAEMREPLRSLVKLPIDVEGLSARLPESLRPKGL